MATGTFKMWNVDRGYGFIADDSGGPDTFLHISALQSAGIDPDNIKKGDRLTFDVESTRVERPRPATSGRAEGEDEMNQRPLIASSPWTAEDNRLRALAKDGRSAAVILNA